MKSIVLAVLFAWASSAAAAANLVAIKHPVFCRRADICYEWMAAKNKTLRFVASGSEQGIAYALYRVDRGGRHRLLMQVHPVIVDTRDGRQYWGYPWDIDDMDFEVDKAGRAFVYASFEHLDIESDAEIEIPKWQKRFPVLRFTGVSTQGDSANLKPVGFTRYDLRDLIRAVRE